MKDLSTYKNIGIIENILTIIADNRDFVSLAANRINDTWFQQWDEKTDELVDTNISTTHSVLQIIIANLLLKYGISQHYDLDRTWAIYYAFVLSLLHFDDCVNLLGSNIEEIKILSKLGCDYALLMEPGVEILNKIKEHHA